MAHILKILRGVVKMTSLVIILAFFLNSINGIFGAFDLADGGVQVQDINPDDFQIKSDDLHMEVGLTMQNNGIYEIRNVLIGVKFELKYNSAVWTAVLNRNSSDHGESIPAGGDPLNIEVKADMDLFLLDADAIGSLLGLTPPWDVSTLFGAGFEAKLTLTFTISYALDQYDLFFEIVIEGADAESGF